MISHLRKRTDDLRFQLELRQQLKLEQEPFLKESIKLREANRTPGERKAQAEEIRRGQIFFSGVVPENHPDWREHWSAAAKVPLHRSCDRQRGWIGYRSPESPLGEGIRTKARSGPNSSGSPVRSQSRRNALKVLQQAPMRCDPTPSRGVSDVGPSANRANGGQHGQPSISKASSRWASKLRSLIGRVEPRRRTNYGCVMS